jgi:hypothetical protein
LSAIDPLKLPEPGSINPAESIVGDFCDPLEPVSYRVLVQPKHAAWAAGCMCNFVESDGFIVSASSFYKLSQGKRKNTIRKCWLSTTTELVILFVAARTKKLKLSEWAFDRVLCNFTTFTTPVRIAP